MESKITILKFGSSVLKAEADLPGAVHEIYRRRRAGKQVLVVVSALGDTTDRLLELAENVCGEQPRSASLAALLATGEATAAALLGLSLQRAGVPAKVLCPSQVGLLTNGDTLDAAPVAVNAERLRKESEAAVVVVSGFVGLNESDDLTLLGRGGSDFTALFLARELEADCVLVKDVAGLYESDPADVFARPRRFARANWQTALAVGGEVVQPKAVRFARQNNLSFSITALGATTATEIGGGADEFAQPESENSPIRVALLGCGTVGGGVYRRLAAMPELFEVVGVADRNFDKARAVGVPENLLTANAAELIESGCDAVVELFGKIEPTRALLKHALQMRRRVVTANKALLAADVDELEDLAGLRGASLRYSAAVGGALPALEIVSLARRSNSLRAFSGIVNGTCNFICDELGKGSDFAAAVEAAQARGFAEADPTLDLNGTDAAQKLILLARAAFGITLPLSAISREGIENLDPARVKRAREGGRAVRLIAECRQTANGIEASVKPLALPASHPFARTEGADNCLLLEINRGEIEFIGGTGAGRWATTEAVIADLLDARREIIDGKPKAAAATARFTTAEASR